jgi:hypothetical protein
MPLLSRLRRHEDDTVHNFGIVGRDIISPQVERATCPQVEAGLVPDL